jgi:DNA-binding response OmpR family regulator
MVSMLVLVVEDDAAIFDPLIGGLERNGFDVVHSQRGEGVVLLVQQHNPDVMLLDLGLPDIDGLQVLKDVRRVSDVPIIIATARGDETDRVVGLEVGADDYVVKPYSVRELSARIRAISRRRRSEPTAGGSTRVRVDRNRHEVFVDDVLVELTLKEFELLAVLAEEPGRVVTRQELFSRVWDPVWIGSGKSLDVHIATLRRKLGYADLIETVRGVGYRLAAT